MKIIKTRWNGKCATTGHTADEFEAMASEAMPGTSDAAKAAAIGICRSYGIRGVCDPAYIANVIQREINRAMEG